MWFGRVRGCCENHNCARDVAQPAVFCPGRLRCPAAGGAAGGPARSGSLNAARDGDDRRPEEPRGQGQPGRRLLAPGLDASRRHWQSTHMDTAPRHAATTNSRRRAARAVSPCLPPPSPATTSPDGAAGFAQEPDAARRHGLLGAVAGGHHRLPAPRRAEARTRCDGAPSPAPLLEPLSASRLPMRRRLVAYRRLRLSASACSRTACTSRGRARSRAPPSATSPRRAAPPRSGTLCPPTRSCRSSC